MAGDEDKENSAEVVGSNLFSLAELLVVVDILFAKDQALSFVKKSPVKLFLSFLNKQPFVFKF